MFYCDKCADENEWPKGTIIKSRGPCEMCGKTADCNDVPSYRLPIKKEDENESKTNNG